MEKNFKSILDEYNNNLDTTINSLAKKHGVNRSKLADYFNRHGIQCNPIKNERKYRLAVEELKKDDTVTLTYLADKYNFDRAAFSRWLKRQNIQYVSANKSTEVFRKQKLAIEMYNDGKSIKSISEELNLSRKSLGLFFKEEKVELRTKAIQHLDDYQLNHLFFEEINTENKAYWLGFIFADGCVRSHGDSYRLSIEVSQIDFNHLKKFRRDIESNHPIKKRKSRNVCNIAINSKKMVSDLFAIGCVQNKTVLGDLDISILNNDVLKIAFLRGFLDGDGYIEKNPRKYRVIYTIKSSKMVDSIIQLLTHFNIHARIDDCKTYYRVAIERKEDFLKLIKLLYENANIYLDRKYETYLLRSQPFLEETPGMMRAELSGEALPNIYPTDGCVLG